MSTHLPALGLEVVRQDFEMTIDVPEGAAPMPMCPTGTTTRTFEADAVISDASVVLAAALLDHHGDYVMTQEQLRHSVDTPRARHDASFVAYDEQGPLGAVLPIDDIEGGYVASLGVARRGRGTGLGQALLQTATTRLYERVGMSVRTGRDMWGRPLGA